LPWRSSTTWAKAVTPRPTRRRVEQRGMAGDDAGLGQALQAAADLRGRQMHGLAERGIGGVAVALHGVEQGEVVAVYGDCSAWN
jgi:hypothetical protein